MRQCINLENSKSSWRSIISSQKQMRKQRRKPHLHSCDIMFIDRLSNVKNHSIISVEPSGFNRPRWTASPRARRISSTLRNLPSSVESLNHPRLSAIRCLWVGQEGCGLVICNCSFRKRHVPCLTAWTFDQYNPLLISTLGELVSRSRATGPGCASKGQGQSGFVIRCCRLSSRSSYRRC